MGECSKALRVLPLLSEIACFDEQLAKQIVVEAGPDADHTQLTVKCLELLSDYICYFPNARNYDHPLVQRFLHPDFIWETEWGVAAKSAQGFLDRMREAAIANPEYRLEPVNTCGSLDRGGASGVVWMVIRTHGQPNPLEEGQVREAIGKFKWERQGGKWYWCSHSVMRGSAEIGWEFG